MGQVNRYYYLTMVRIMPKTASWLCTQLQLCGCLALNLHETPVFTNAQVTDQNCAIKTGYLWRI